MAYLKQGFYPAVSDYISHLGGHQDLKDLWHDKGEKRLRLSEQELEQLFDALADEDFEKAKEILKK